MKTSALIVTGINTIIPGEIEIAPPGPGQVLVRTAFSGISPGTELRKMTGVEGDGFPYLPGYTQTGVIEQVGEGVTGLTVGTRVWCGGTQVADVPLFWGGHTSFAVRAAATVIPLPDNVGLEDAAIAKLAAIAYHGLRLARPLPHETVAIIGLGPIGQCAARVYAAVGATVVAVDLSPERVDLARQAGVTALVPVEGIAAAVRQVMPKGADIVVDCTGANAVIPDAVECARQREWDNLPLPGARFVVQGSYAQGFTFPYDAVFRRELQILVPRDHLLADLAGVLDLMGRGRLSLRELITETREPSAAQATYEELRNAKGRLVTAAFRWS